MATASTQPRGHYVWSSTTKVIELDFASNDATGLRATIRHSALDQSGEEASIVRSLFGSSDGEHFILRVTIEPGLAGALPSGTIITGRRRNDSDLVLAINGRDVVMQPTTITQYRHLLHDLHIMGRFYQALRAQAVLEKHMRNFTRWAHQRVRDVARVKNFYRQRESLYRHCLEMMRRLVLGPKRANPSRPRTRTCVDAVDADTAALDEERSMVLAWSFELAKRSGAIEAHLESTAEALKHWSVLAVTASAHLSTSAQGTAIIAHLDNALRSGSPAADFASFGAYKGALPAVRLAIRKSLDAARRGNAKLKGLAAKIDLLEHAAISRIRS